MVSNDARDGGLHHWISPARLLLLLLFLAALPSAAPYAGADDEEAPTEEGDRTDAAGATEQTALTFHGTAAFKTLGSLGQEDFNFSLGIKNPQAEPIEIRKANLLLAHLGGWLVPLDPDSLDGSFFRGALTVPGGEEIAGAGNKYVSITPATHALLTVQAADGHAVIPFPILREGWDAPKAYRAPYPFGVGLVGPLHVLPFSDGEASILIVGQHQVLGGGEPSEVETSLQVGNDEGSGDPIAWEGLDAEGDLTALWPFVRRVPVFDGFESGLLRLTSTATVNGRKETFTGTWPVTRMQPVAVRPPLMGAWQLSNGPGSAGVSLQDAKPQDRYAYDMVVVRQGRTHKGNPHKNDSYYAWDRDILAVADGEVVDFCDHERDNPGYRGAFTQCYNNRVVLKHDGDIFSAYLHLQKSSCPRSIRVRGNKVRAGQPIAKVGNSGNSAEPHLHFIVFRIDASGRIRSVPVTFTNAYHDALYSKPVKGVPLSGPTYHFRGK